MELRQIELFVVLARHGSFTGAARVLGLAQPALSQQIKRLEQELGSVLLDRSTRPVQLTEAGATFLLRAERILAEAALLRQEMGELVAGGRGRLALGALPALAALWLPPLLGSFHELHPGVEISLGLGRPDELREQLARGQLDLALLHAVPGLVTRSSSAVSLVLERLFDEELVLVVPADHALAGRRSVSLAQLRDEPFVLVPQGSGLTQTILSSATSLGFTPAVSAEASDVTTVRSLVAAGLGISIMPRLPAECEGPEVGVVALDPPLPSHTTVVAWRADTQPSTATTALLGIIRRHVAAGWSPAGSGGASRRLSDPSSSGPASSSARGEGGSRAARRP